MPQMETPQKDESQVELETICTSCCGKGGWFDPIDGEGAFCPDCKGAGYIPTPAGKNILALLRHNFRPLLAETRS